MALLTVPGSQAKFSLNAEQLERVTEFVRSLNAPVVDDAPDLTRHERAERKADCIHSLVVARLTDDELLSDNPTTPIPMPSSLIPGCFWTQKMQSHFISNASRIRLNRFSAAGRDGTKRAEIIDDWFDRDSHKAGPGIRHAIIKAEVSAALPQLPTQHHVTHGPVLSKWLSNNYMKMSLEKRNMFIDAMECLRKNREFYDVVLDVLLQSDPDEFISSLFFGGRLGDVKTIEVPNVFVPIMGLRSIVDGRGEAVIPLLFEGCRWNSGTDEYDIVTAEGGWHVKDLGNSAKCHLGKNGYLGCSTAERLIKLSKSLQWEDEGKARVNKDLTKALVRSNIDLILMEFGSLQGFQDSLNADMRTSESDTQGIVFMRGNRLEIRRMDDCFCAGATRGDFQVSHLDNQQFNVSLAAP